MSNLPRRSDSAIPARPQKHRAPGAAELRLHRALSEYRSRYSPGHAGAVREIESAVNEVVDDMRGQGRDAGAVIVALKAVLAEYPATALIHADAVRRGIERFYQSDNASGQPERGPLPRS